MTPGELKSLATSGPGQAFLAYLKAQRTAALEALVNARGEDVLHLQARAKVFGSLIGDLERALDKADRSV